MLTQTMLTNRIALVTGSTGGGMGRSTALTLAQHGADIVLNYGTHHGEAEAANQTADRAETVAQAIRAMGRRALIVQADTRDASAVEAMVAQAIETFGKLDILVNNAGGGWNPQDITDLSPEQFRGEIAAELDGAFHCIRACLPHMRAQQWGRIVLMGAYGAGHWAAEHGEPIEYALGKGGRALLNRHLSLRERQHNITVNLINPGPGHTAHFETLDQAVTFAKHEATWQMRDRATPQDIADAILFLCSEEARFITGSAINFALA